MRVVSYPEAEVPVALRRQVVALQEEAWPTGRPLVATPRHDPVLRPRSLLLVDRERVVSALDILSKEIEHDGEQYAASGLSTVVTGLRDRGQGHGARLVGKAKRLIADAGADLGIFTCDEELQSFYERAGWPVLPGAVLVGGTPDEPFPSDQFSKVTVACFFSPRAQAAAASFTGRRIELYPGMIDRLW